jgi:uncharacterized protein (DUF2062 family)
MMALRRGLMMRKLIHRHLPRHETITENRWLAPFATTLLHPRLWHLNRRSAAAAVAIGLFCGLVPGPLQMISAGIVCVLLRVNLPLALFTTLYTNPFTIIPLYVLAYGMGNALLGHSGAAFIAPPDLGNQDLLTWTRQLIDWMITLGEPLALGLLALATSLALAGYILVRIIWRWYLVRRWRQRRSCQR